MLKPLATAALIALAAPAHAGLREAISNFIDGNAGLQGPGNSAAERARQTQANEDFVDANIRASWSLESRVNSIDTAYARGRIGRTEHARLTRNAYSNYNTARNAAAARRSAAAAAGHIRLNVDGSPAHGYGPRGN